MTPNINPSEQLHVALFLYYFCTNYTFGSVIMVGCCWVGKQRSVSIWLSSGSPTFSAQRCGSSSGRHLVSGSIEEHEARLIDVARCLVRHWKRSLECSLLCQLWHENHSFLFQVVSNTEGINARSSLFCMRSFQETVWADLNICVRLDANGRWGICFFNLKSLEKLIFMNA